LLNFYSIIIAVGKIILVTPAEGSRVGRFLPPFVCLSVCFPHDISKTDAAKITKRGIEMFQD